MPQLTRVTPIILTYNEIANIELTLDRLLWAKRVVVVDSGSEDGTRAVVRETENADLVSRAFESHRDQWEYAIGQADTEWVLTLDADYRVSQALVEEIASIPDETPKTGFYVEFDFRILGTILSETLYPPKQVLFRRRYARVVQEADTERIRVEGQSGQLQTPIVHDDRKSFSRWLRKQEKYTEFAAQKILNADWSELKLTDRIRRTRLLGAPAVFLYCLVVKGLGFKGWAGWYYIMRRTLVEILRSLAMMRNIYGTDDSAQTEREKSKRSWEKRDE